MSVCAVGTLCSANSISAARIVIQHSAPKQHNMQCEQVCAFFHSSLTEHKWHSMMSSCSTGNEHCITDCHFIFFNAFSQEKAKGWISCHPFVQFFTFHCLQAQQRCVQALFTIFLPFWRTSVSAFLPWHCWLPTWSACQSKNETHGLLHKSKNLWCCPCVKNHIHWIMTTWRFRLSCCLKKWSWPEISWGRAVN